jgi:hypothetical protein
MNANNKPVANQRAGDGFIVYNVVTFGGWKPPPGD